MEGLSWKLKWVNIFLIFIQSEALLPCLKKPPFDPVMSQFNPVLTFILPSTAKFHSLSPPLVSSLEVFILKICVHIWFPPVVITVPANIFLVHLISLIILEVVYILSHVRWYAWQEWWVLVRMIGFICTLVKTFFNYTQITALSLIYTLHNPLLHSHYSSPGNRIKTQELALQITPSITHE
jgi:hypothetical protein